MGLVMSAETEETEYMGLFSLLLFFFSFSASIVGCCGYMILPKEATPMKNPYGSIAIKNAKVAPAGVAIASPSGAGDEAAGRAAITNSGSISNSGGGAGTASTTEYIDASRLTKGS